MLSQTNFNSIWFLYRILDLNVLGSLKERNEEPNRQTAVYLLHCSSYFYKQF